MLENHFDYDISDFLIHKKLKLKTLNKYSINEHIIQTIKNSFLEKDKYLNIYSEEYITNYNVIKAKELIKFYPKNEKENEDNIVKKFLKCYKAISGEKINEEEIDTMNISLWEKTIEILSIEILKILDKDKIISHSLIRMNLNEEEELIQNLNLFYSILFLYIKDKNTINLYNFIPNEKKHYKKYNDIFCNKDIDKEIRLILAYLDENNIFDDILIYYKIKFGITHQQKTLEDITKEVDKEIKKKFTNVDNLFEVQKKEIIIDEKLKIACQKLIHEWFVIHSDKRNLFDFVNSHISDICIKILCDKDFKDKLDEIFITNQEYFNRIINEIKKKKNQMNSHKSEKSISNSNNKYNSNTYNIIISIIIIIIIIKIIIMIIN
jgi:hypothetical protein